MKKSILISGPQGSGKTQELRQILSHYKHLKTSSIIDGFSYTEIEKHILNQCVVIVIEGIQNSIQLRMLLEFTYHHKNLFFIVTTQLPISILSKYLLCEFDVRIIEPTTNTDTKPNNEKKVKSIQKYTFEIIHYEDGNSVINRTNDGFSVIEMLGITSIINKSLMEVFDGAIKPTAEVNRVATNSPLIHKPK